MGPSGRAAACRWGVAAALLMTGRVVAVEPRPVSFPAADGMRLVADYYPPPVTNRLAVPMVILLHGAGSDRGVWSGCVASLHDAGFAVLAPDLRGHGDSATTETRQAAADGDPELFRRMQEDLRGAYDWLAQQPELDRARFALVGVGVGCSVALQYAAKDRSVDAIVGVSPVLNACGLDTAGDIGQITGRKILLLAAETERDAPYTLQKRGRGIAVRVFAPAAAEPGPAGVSAEWAGEAAPFLRLAVGEPTATTVYGSINSHIYHAAESGWLKRILPTNLRYYSSAQEAESRGLRAARAGPAARDSTPADEGPNRRRGR